MSERTEWAVIDGVGIGKRAGPFSTREEAEAYCRAHEMTHARIAGKDIEYAPGPYVASRRITDWERA